MVLVDFVIYLVVDAQHRFHQFPKASSLRSHYTEIKP